MSFLKWNDHNHYKNNKWYAYKSIKVDISFRKKKCVVSVVNNEKYEEMTKDSALRDPDSTRQGSNSAL